ncbi:hypothetical protein AB4Z46_32780 [Variovorax sp. M-6]|uniref:hypothetical protein n=1 Tax=Variovorax sp. M-6 TaxID=3233041 RepID=UPI003F9D2C42
MTVHNEQPTVWSAGLDALTVMALEAYGATSTDAVRGAIENNVNIPGISHARKATIRQWLGMPREPMLGSHLTNASTIARAILTLERNGYKVVPPISTAQ